MAIEQIFDNIKDYDSIKLENITNVLGVLDICINDTNLYGDDFIVALENKEEVHSIIKRKLLQSFEDDKKVIVENILGKRQVHAIDGEITQSHYKTCELMTSTYDDKLYSKYIFSIDKAIKYIQENNIKPKYVRVDSLYRFSKNIKISGKSYSPDKPILAIKAPHIKEGIIVLDGNHRVVEAVEAYTEILQGYMLHADVFSKIVICKFFYVLCLSEQIVDYIVRYRTGEVDKRTFNEYFEMFSKIDV